MAFCTHCGSNVKDDDVFCNGCGKSPWPRGHQQTGPPVPAHPGMTPAPHAPPPTGPPPAQQGPAGIAATMYAASGTGSPAAAPAPAPAASQPGMEATMFAAADSPQFAPPGRAPSSPPPMAPPPMAPPPMAPPPMAPPPMAPSTPAPSYSAPQPAAPASTALTTGDIARPYQILDLITETANNSGPSSRGDEIRSRAFADLKLKLQRTCSRMGGEAVINLRFETRSQDDGRNQQWTIFAFGNVIRFSG